MAEAPYYRAEAAKCRKLAAAAADREARERWLQIASEYEQLAEALESKSGYRPPFVTVPMQQQPMQQQQAKTEPKDE